jgi:glutamate-1-semialdehyde 2,1-aminomutase
MNRSSSLLEASRQVIPGGVNSPVRAFAAVEGDPPFIARGEGAFVEDVDGNRYLDLVGSWGPLILGHADPDVVAAVIAAARLGASFGAPTEGELRFAEELCAAHPALEQVRLCSSGTEATMHALRLARGFTGRDAVVKIDGCYHGAHDALLVAAGSGVATFGGTATRGAAAPGSAGVPAAVAALTRTAPFNDLAAVEAHLVHRDVAAVIIEPVPGNMGCILPDPGYLEGLRALCTLHGTLLVVDEVMTGFRLARGGAAERLGIVGDLVTMGKIVGGGLPLAVFGGRRDIMAHLSPLGPVYQGGTLSGNPVAVAAGRATLAKLDNNLYARLEVVSAALEAGLRPLIEAAGGSFVRMGSMFTLYFRATPPRNFNEVKECDTARFGRFHRQALNHGVYLPPSQFEAAFVPAVLSDADVIAIVKGVGAALAAVDGPRALD